MCGENQQLLIDKIKSLQTYKLFPGDTELYLSRDDVLTTIMLHEDTRACRFCRNWFSLSLRTGYGRCNLNMCVTKKKDYCSWFERGIKDDEKNM